MINYKEQSPETQPFTVQEIVDIALGYIDLDGTVLLAQFGGRLSPVACFESVRTEEMNDELWLRCLMKVAWTLFRNFKQGVQYDEERLKILALYLGAYRHEKSFLSSVISLMPYESGWLSSPRLPAGPDVQRNTEILRKR